MLFSIKNQKKYDVVSLPVHLVGQKTRPPREILTLLFLLLKTPSEDMCLG